MDTSKREIIFQSKRGKLTALKHEDLYTLDFPQEPKIEECDGVKYLKLFNIKPSEIYQISNHSIMAVFESEDNIK